MEDERAEFSGKHEIEAYFIELFYHILTYI
jgi:hypothetical protein